MLKLVYCLRRKDDVTPEEFYRTWLKDHGPLVKSFAKAMNASRYVQSHTCMPEANANLIASRGLEDPYDGITEVWWNSREDFEAGSATEEGRKAAKALLEDESRFIDFARSRVFMTEEHEIFNYE